MLKQIRNGALDNPWIFKVLMLFIALAFVITMGWGSGMNKPEDNVVAQVGEVKINRLQYVNRYRNDRQIYQKILKENFKEEMVKQIVINNLIEIELWLSLARDLNLEVGEEELRSRITTDPRFFNEDAEFDAKRYRFFLERGGVTAAAFEDSIGKELLINKAKQVVQDGISLTDEEVRKAKALVTGKDLSPGKRQEEEDLQVENSLAQKQQKVLSSVLSRVRAKTPIEIQDHLL